MSSKQPPAKPTDRKTAAVIVSLLQGPLTKTEKEMLATVTQELVSFRTTFGSDGVAILGKESVDWSAYLALRCTLRKMEKDINDLSNYWKSSGMQSSLVSYKVAKLEQHTKSALQLTKDIKEV